MNKKEKKIEAIEENKNERKMIESVGVFTQADAICTIITFKMLLPNAAQCLNNHLRETTKCIKIRNICSLNADFFGWVELNWKWNGSAHLLN